MSVSPSRRSLDLQYAIPTLKLTVLILRIIQFVAVLTLSILYSTSHPPVYYDLLVWPQNATPPYNITVYRNMTKTYRQKVLLDELQPANTTWFERGATEPLTGQHWSTGEENGEENLAMERMGWADSEGFEPHSWLKSVVHLDRYIFFFLMGAGYVAIGHNLAVLVYTIAPSEAVHTFGFYRYTAVVDFLLSTAFLCLGVFPLAIIQQYNSVSHIYSYPFSNFNAKILDKSTGLKFWGRLTESQKYALRIGWTCWFLYLASFVTLTVLISNMAKYKLLEDTEKFELENMSGLTLRYQHSHQPPCLPPLQSLSEGHATVRECEELPYAHETLNPVATSTGFKIEMPSGVASISRGTRNSQ